MAYQSISVLALAIAALADGSEDHSFPDTMSCAANEAIATFGAGCFWSVELAFQRLPGVIRTQVGYMGGSVDRPSYKEVYAGGTGHVEVVQLVFDPSVVTFTELLDVFAKKLPTSKARALASPPGLPDTPLRSVVPMAMQDHETVGSHLTFDQLVAAHNPKDDHGTQYRSVVFVHDEAQQQEATRWKQGLQAERDATGAGGTIVTAIEPALPFWPAEEYHRAVRRA